MMTILKKSSFATSVLKKELHDLNQEVKSTDETNRKLVEKGDVLLETLKGFLLTIKKYY